jgi:hypothetical protein
MTNEQKQWLADSYANAWRAVKGGNMTVTIEPHGWFVIHYGYPMHPSKVRAEKLLKGLSILTGRLLKRDIEA